MSTRRATITTLNAGKCRIDTVYNDYTRELSGVWLIHSAGEFILGPRAAESLRDLFADVLAVENGPAAKDTHISDGEYFDFRRADWRFRRGYTLRACMGNDESQSFITRTALNMERDQAVKLLDELNKALAPVSVNV